MRDREKFGKELSDFFDSEDSVVLITGLDDDEKIRRILIKLNDRYSRGTFYVNSILHAGDLLNRALGRNNTVFPARINGKKTYSIGNMRLSFRKYSDELYGSSLSENDDFAVFYPVQVALGKERTLKRLIDHINGSEALKTVIVTTNDLYTEIDILKSVIDQHIHYECKNDKNSLYETEKRNIDISKYINPVYNELK